MNRAHQFGENKRAPTAKSVRQGRSRGMWLLVLFGLVFAVAGGLGTWFFSVNTWLRLEDSRSWAEVPAVITASKVVTSRTSDGTSYRPDITFSYNWEGRQYEGSSWRLMNVSSSNRDRARKVVRTYSVGSQHMAWVNPADPADAVLDRTLGWSLSLTFIPVVFLLVGLGISGFGFREHRRRAVDSLVRSGDSLADGGWRDAKLLGLPDLPSESRAGEPLVLTPRQGALGRLLGIAFFAVFWNGITWTILGMLLLDGRRDGNFELFPILFLSGFALIGAIVIVAFFYTLIGFILGPRVSVTTVSQTLKPGEVWEVAWQFSRGSGRIRDFRLTLEGQTEGDYTRNTSKNSSRVTDEKVFLRQDIFTSAEPGEIVRGSAKLQIPPDLPHSFAAKNNRIRYQVCLVAAASLMPNLREEYTVFVPPAITPDSSSSSPGSV